MSNSLTVKVGSKTVEVVEKTVKKNDCRGCYFSYDNRWSSCPERCCLSTVDNAPIIYKQKV